MKIIQEFPPNYDLIRIVLNPPSNAIFAYGDIIYNPSGLDLPEDIILHENVHKKQQGNEVPQWWNKYLSDKKFRFNQELEAYSYQYQFIKKHYPAKATKDALLELAHNLTELYDIDMSIGEAESKIRNYASKKRTIS